KFRAYKAYSRTRRRTFPTPSRPPCGLWAPAVATSNRLQNRCPLLRDTLMFHPVQAPSLRHAPELVNAAILEADSRLRHQILDRARDQDLSGTRFRGDARADVERETEHLSPAHFGLARVLPTAGPHPCPAHSLPHCRTPTDPRRHPRD